MAAIYIDDNKLIFDELSILDLTKEEYDKIKERMNNFVEFHNHWHKYSPKSMIE